MQATSRRLLATIALVGAVVTLAGCSPKVTPSTPKVVPAPPATATTNASEAPGVAPPGPSPRPATRVDVVTFFISREKVSAARRSVLAPSVAKGAVQELLAGPTAAEHAAGMSSLIPKGTRLLGLTVSGGTATVDLSGEFASGGGSLSMTGRVAQVVFTLTQFDTVQRVAFRMDGKPLDVLGGEGVILEKPQTRADWEDFAPAVLIEDPASGDEVSSSLRVTGSANVFEAVFFLELLDSNGSKIVEKRVQATSGTGTRGTFDSTVSWSGKASGSATLVAFYLSPKDGKKVVVTRVPVTIK